MVAIKRVAAELSFLHPSSFSLATNFTFLSVAWYVKSLHIVLRVPMEMD